MKNEKSVDFIPYLPFSKDKVDIMGMISTDPFGYYTGRPADPTELPVQDVDDL